MTAILTKALLIFFLVALFCSSIGFYKYVYFISIGYGLAISGQGIALLAFFADRLTPAIVITAIILILYGLRLGAVFVIVGDCKTPVSVL